MRFAVLPTAFCLCVLLAGCASESDAESAPAATADVTPPAEPTADKTDPPSSTAPAPEQAASQAEQKPPEEKSADRKSAEEKPAAQTAEPKKDAPKSDSPFVPGDQKTFDLGVAAYDAHYYKRAFKIFSKLAEDEDLAAMRNVAYMQRKGQGTDKDPEAALALYEYVARAGLPTAQFDLAEMLLDGEAGEPDPKAGLAWLQLAAKHSHPLAQYRLGVLYEEGVLVPKNLFHAELLYSAAAQHGSKKALERLSALKGWPKPDGLSGEPVPGLQPLEPGVLSPGTHP